METVRATVTYSLDTGAKPVAESMSAGGRVEFRNAQFEDREIAVHDARAVADELSLDRQGFVLVRGRSRVPDAHDDATLEREYYPQMAELVRAISGATRVHVFDHTLRSGDDSRGRREPVANVHNDYTEWSAPQRVRDLLPEEADDLLQHRFAVIQTWQPIEPVRHRPLCICDARTMAPADLIATERRHPGRVGEIYHIAPNAAHRWYWVPQMQPDEAFVFKTYDSAKDGRARFTAHGSFEDPTAPADAPPRESLELRTLAFFAPAATTG